MQAHAGRSALRRRSMPYQGMSRSISKTRTPSSASAPKRSIPLTLQARGKDFELVYPQDCEPEPRCRTYPAQKPAQSKAIEQPLVQILSPVSVRPRTTSVTACWRKLEAAAPCRPRSVRGERSQMRSRPVLHPSAPSFRNRDCAVHMPSGGARSSLTATRLLHFVLPMNRVLHSSRMYGSPLAQ